MTRSSNGKPDKSRRRVKIRDETRQLVSEYLTIIDECKSDEAVARRRFLAGIRRMQKLDPKLRAAELSYASEDDPHDVHWGTSAAQSYIEEAVNGHRTRRKSKAQMEMDWVNATAAQLPPEERDQFFAERDQFNSQLVQRFTGEDHSRASESSSERTGQAA
jgi:hypothetical protein